MPAYVSSQKTIDLTFDSDIEVITPQFEKIQFTNSGEVLVSRPDKIAAPGTLDQLFTALRAGRRV